MTPYFNKLQELRDGDAIAQETLIYCIQHGICINGKCLAWLLENHPELIYDEYFDDFKNATRWTIGKAYILGLNDGFYRIWERVGLTEAQHSEFYDQTPELVMMNELVVTEWIGFEEVYDD